MKSRNSAVFLCVLSVILYVCLSSPIASASYSQQNEVIKISEVDKHFDYPLPQERKIAESEGCSNGQRTYFDGCNRCSCPKPHRKSWCSRRACLRRLHRG